MRVLRMLLMRARALCAAAPSIATSPTRCASTSERLAQEHIARGMTPEAAREAARREFGPVTQLVEESRDARGVMWIVNGWHDVRYGVRLMGRAPGFAAAVILTVALGIGATTAMFSVVYGVVLKPLPYGDPDRLVNLWTTAPERGVPRGHVAMANVYDWKARNHVFTDVAVLRPIANFNLTGAGEPERLNGSRVSANLFPLLGVMPLHGRLFRDDEDTDGRDRVAILSYGLWHRRFGGDPSIVGRTIALERVAVHGGRRHAPDFAFPSRDYQIYVAADVRSAELVNRLNYSYLAVARLKPGVTARAGAGRDGSDLRPDSRRSIRKRTRASAPRWHRCGPTRSRRCARRYMCCLARSRRCC